MSKRGDGLVFGMIIVIMTIFYSILHPIDAFKDARIYVVAVWTVILAVGTFAYYSCLT